MIALGFLISVRINYRICLLQKEKHHGRKPQYAEDDPRLLHAFKLYQTGMSDVDVARNTGIKRTTFIRYRRKFNVKREGA